MRHDKNIGDLDYLSERGFETIAFDEQDLLQLKKQIKTRSLSYNSGWRSALIMLITGIFIGVSVFFAFFSSNAVPLSASEKMIVQPQMLPEKGVARTETA